MMQHMCRRPTAAAAATLAAKLKWLLQQVALQALPSIWPCLRLLPQMQCPCWRRCLPAVPPARGLPLVHSGPSCTRASPGWPLPLRNLRGLPCPVCAVPGGMASPSQLHTPRPASSAAPCRRPRQVHDAAILPAYRGARLRAFLAACDECDEAGTVKEHYVADAACCLVCAENNKVCRPSRWQAIGGLQGCACGGASDGRASGLGWALLPMQSWLGCRGGVAPRRPVASGPAHACGCLCGWLAAAPGRDESSLLHGRDRGQHVLRCSRWHPERMPTRARQKPSLQSGESRSFRHASNKLAGAGPSRQVELAGLALFGWFAGRPARQPAVCLRSLCCQRTSLPSGCRARLCSRPRPAPRCRAGTRGGGACRASRAACASCALWAAPLSTQPPTRWLVPPARAPYRLAPPATHLPHPPRPTPPHTHSRTAALIREAETCILSQDALESFQQGAAPEEAAEAAAQAQRDLDAKLRHWQQARVAAGFEEGPALSGGASQRRCQRQPGGQTAGPAATSGHVKRPSASRSDSTLPPGVRGRLAWGCAQHGGPEAAPAPVPCWLVATPTPG